MQQLHRCPGWRICGQSSHPSEALGATCDQHNSGPPFGRQRTGHLVFFGCHCLESLTKFRWPHHLMNQHSPPAVQGLRLKAVLVLVKVGLVLQEVQGSTRLQPVGLLPGPGALERWPSLHSSQHSGDGRSSCCGSSAPMGRSGHLPGDDRCTETDSNQNQRFNEEIKFLSNK